MTNYKMYNYHSIINDDFVLLFNYLMEIQINLLYNINVESKNMKLEKMSKVMFFTACLVFTFITPPALAQSKPLLAILPFAGGADGDGETIANLFSSEPGILNAFEVVPRTRAVDAIISEQNFQMSGYTDSDTIARLGQMLNADFVVSGQIRRLGNNNLIIVTVVNVQTFEQLAGAYRQYRKIEEIPVLLPGISGIIINATQKNTDNLPKLAVIPFHIANTGAGLQDAEVLAQILAVDIANTGKYAVLPRLTAALEAAAGEQAFQISGHTSDEGAVAVGKALNAEYVLNAEVRSLGRKNLFTAQIIHVESGRLLAGASREYRTVTDGIASILKLALDLTDPEGKVARDRKEASHFWSVGASAGTSFADPWVIGTVHATIAPFPFSFLQIGFDTGFISGIETVTGYYSLYPFAHYVFFMPLPAKGNMFKGGLFAGAGFGFMVDEYRIDDWSRNRSFLAADVTAGVNIADMINVSYSLRTDFNSVSNKVAMGYTYRYNGPNVSNISSEGVYSYTVDNKTPSENQWNSIIGVSYQGTPGVSNYGFALKGIFSPRSLMFFDFGASVGFGNLSFSPYTNFCFSLPFDFSIISGNWYAGIGISFLAGFDGDNNFSDVISYFAGNFVTGFLLWDWLNISFTYYLGEKLNGEFFYDKFNYSVGYTYRFK